VSSTLEPFQHKIEDLEMEVQVIQDSVSEHKLKVASQNDVILKRVRELERAGKGRNIRMTGLVPSDTPADGSTHDKYLTTMRKILEEAKFLGFHDTDFLEFTKINIPNQTGPNHVVLLKMVCESKRDSLFAQKNKLKNCASKIFINEDLTRHDAKIFKRVRGEVKSGSLHSCWTKHGLVWAKATQDGKPFPVPE
jgi:hypothetical protein